MDEADSWNLYNTALNDNLKLGPLHYALASDDIPPQEVGTCFATIQDEFFRANPEFVANNNTQGKKFMYRIPKSVNEARKLKNKRRKLAFKKHSSNIDKSRFFEALTAYDYLKKEKTKVESKRNTVYEEKKYRLDFWKYSKSLFNGTINSSPLGPTFNKETADKYFTQKYEISPSIDLNSLSWIPELQLCTDPLGIEDGTIPAEQLSVSSEWSLRTGAHSGRLNTEADSLGRGGAWCSKTKDQYQWIQVDLGKMHKRFDGNSDQDTTVTNIFSEPIYAQFVRIHPVDWNKNICLRFEVLGCSAELCIDPLGIEDGNIPAEQLSASSEPALMHEAHRGRLNNEANSKGFGGAWSSKTNDRHQWIQVDLGKLHRVHGVITQGRNGYIPYQYVTSYEIVYSVDGNHFQPIRNSDCQVTLCTDPLGIEDGTIPAEQLSASSEWTLRNGAHRGRLNTEADSLGVGAWCSKTIDQYQWIQVDLGKLHMVRGVITQGRNKCCLQWVTSYEIFYSVDGNLFQPIRNSDCQVTRFVGNSDEDTTVTNIFPDPVYAKFVRIHPTNWHNWISLRFEVLGCSAGDGLKLILCWKPLFFNDFRSREQP
ncbi:lactadherin-like [Anneissia japonica]|uniref:lactadherin-like n=1 Tax=Anneissia japonica TaxID=1529436 RepID=UPI001425B0D0|nr:lactadherin-like [Anneissia japonica]